MSTEAPAFVVGIDLGTTNSAVAYVDLRADAGAAAALQLLPIPQVTGDGEVGALPVLPSFLYLPGAYELAPEAVALPWRRTVERVVGRFARDHGAKVPSRLVASAKSWLCHERVDRTAPILPWGADDQVPKVSPVAATAAYLEHIRAAWNRHWDDDADCYLENQLTVVTVPASFDEVARDLTLSAAKMAGLPAVVLLEEPLAAFYSWLRRHQTDWQRHVQPGQLIVVCDVGGGTTDFTLITLREVEGQPRFERIAVGDHLILGGDNIDLALARRAEQQFRAPGVNLSGDRWKTLCHQCRQAKEAILAGAAERRRVTVTGAGASLIGGTVFAELDRAAVETIVLEGFFPAVASREPPTGQVPKGITEFGLPYEPEAAITRHLVWFLERHRPAVERRDPCPDLILFNGGSLTPDLIQERIRTVLRDAYAVADDDRPARLANPEPELAVARGAAYYGLVKLGRGVRVGSGSPRSFFLALGRTGTATDATPTAHTARETICLVERGLEEGSTLSLPEQRFEVLTNRPVTLELFSSSYRSGDRCGDVVPVDDSMTALPPVHTVIQFGRKAREARIPVRIEGVYTEVGTLELWCRSLASSHRWRLQFQLRQTPAAVDLGQDAVLEEERVGQARDLVRRTIAPDATLPQLDRLPRAISRTVDLAREDWPLGLLRTLADDLLDLAQVRRTSAEMEARWYNLTGFCLRPGYGEGFDGARLKRAWKLHHGGLAHPRKAQARSEWWVFWRRVAGGLSAGQQRQLAQTITGLLAPPRGRKGRLGAQERLEVWMTAANLERLTTTDKIRWGRQLLDEVRPKRCKPQHLWVVGRFGARELLYGPADRVVPPDEIVTWVERLLSQAWPAPRAVAAALAQLARRTGDRSRDLPDGVLMRIADWLPDDDAGALCRRVITAVVPLADEERHTAFGEQLPAGIVLQA